MPRYSTHYSILKQRQSRPNRRFVSPLDALAQSTMPISTTLQTAKLFSHIRDELKTFLQNDIGTYCHIVRLDTEQLIIAVPNAAVASKLRQLAPSIATYLAQQGYNISKMNIKVSAELNQLSPNISSPSLHTSNKHSLSQCHQAFQRFIEENPHSDLTPVLRKILDKPSK